jgi:hypothetical protein
MISEQRLCESVDFLGDIAEATEGKFCFWKLAEKVGTEIGRTRKLAENKAFLVISAWTCLSAK